MNRSATVIQTAWRCFNTQLCYYFDLSDIVFVQSIVRKQIAMKSFEDQKIAVVKIQTKTRSFLACQKFDSKRNQETASIIIQVRTKPVYVFVCAIFTIVNILCLKYKWLFIFYRDVHAVG